MGVFKTDEEIKALLEHPNNGLNKVKVHIIGSGNHGNQSHDDKKAGNQHRSTESKAQVAILAEVLDSNKVAGELLGVGPTQVSQYRSGKNANNIVDAELVRARNEKLNGITKKVVDRVDTLMDIFVEEKLADLKASEIPGAAEKLIGIFDKINRKDEGSNGNGKGVVVNLFAPKQINVSQLITKEV